MLLQAPINTLGYGYTGYHIATQSARFSNIALFPIGQLDPNLDVSNLLWLNKKYKNTENEVKIWHQHELTTWVGKGTRFGFPIFELTHFNQQEKLSINCCDELLVTSDWAKKVIESVTNKPVHVVPLGVDVSIFNPNNNITREPTVFFNCGKWEIRKGHDVLIECFSRAFTQSDNVELWLMCENPFLPEGGSDWVKKAKNSPLGHKIRIIPRQPDQKSVYNIMRQIDCGVFPSRAEGWNLELLEVMACGKQVITTNYAAHTQFCTNKNSYLVNIDDLELAQDGIWFHGQGLWAKITEKQKEQLITNMRLVHNNKQSQSAEFLNLAGVETANKFTWENSAKTMLKQTGD